MSTPANRWSNLRRPTPDPSAPNTPSPGTQTFLLTVGRIRLFLSLLFQLPLTTIHHYLFGPLLSWQLLQTRLLVVYLKLASSSISATHLPAIDPQAWGIPTVPFKAMAERKKDQVVDIITLQPVDDRYRQGVGICEGVKAVQVPGFVLTPPDAPSKGMEAAKSGERVVLYLVGGGYTVGHPIRYSFAWQMAKSRHCRLLGVNYRKVLDSGSAFPAPILDALAGYLYLTKTLHFEAKDILLMGDSAGGHLSLALSRYLSELSLPLPSRTAFSSPWSDWTNSFPSRKSNTPYDFLAMSVGDLGTSSAMRHYTPEARRDAYFSPALAGGGEFDYLRKSGVRVYVQLGTKELLCDEARALVKGMERDGVDVQLKEIVDGLHCDTVAQWPGSNAFEIWSEDVKQLVGVRGTTSEKEEVATAATMLLSDPPDGL